MSRTELPDAHSDGIQLLDLSKGRQSRSFLVGMTLDLDNSIQPSLCQSVLKESGYHQNKDNNKANKKQLKCPHIKTDEGEELKLIMIKLILKK